MPSEAGIHRHGESVRTVKLWKIRMFSLGDHEFLLWFGLVCSFPEKYCFYTVSQELLLDICTIVLFQLATKSLFIFLSTVRKYLIRHMLTDRFALSSLGKPSGSSIPQDGQGSGRGRGRKRREQRLHPGLMLTMLFQRLIMNPLRTPSYLEKSRTVRNMRMLQLSHSWHK